jgi:phospholipid transport system substrate-binding protein
VKRSFVRFFASALSVLALTFAAVGPAFAGPGTDTVKARQAALFDLLRQGSPDAQKKIDAIFDDMIDYASFAESSLGTEWAARTDAEKAEFSDLLKQLVRKSYQKNLKKILNYDVVYAGEDAADAGVMVKTQSKAKDNARDEGVEIDFKMVQKGAAWKVQDIVTEGVSTVSSYRGQFTKIIKKDGFRALIDKMKKKLADGDV